MDQILPAEDPAPTPPSQPTPDESAPAAPEPSAPHAEAPQQSAPEAALPGEGDPQDAAAQAGEVPGMHEQLAELVARAEKGRLSAPDEERAAQAIKSVLLDGRAGVAAALEVLPKFAWMVAVNGVTLAWPELTAGFRTQLFAGLAKDESDAARRLRLSLARGLFKQDPATALKLAAAVAKDFREKESGGLSAKDAQMFASVFIGRVKPWLAVLPLAELKPAEAEALVHCALSAAFSLPHPPVTQLGVIKWAAGADQLASLPEPILELVKKGLSRWNAKWQNILRKEVAGLPEALAAALTAPEAAAEPEPTRGRRSKQQPKQGEDEGEAQPDSQDQDPAEDGGEEREEDEDDEEEDDDADDADDEEDDGDDEDDEGDAPAKPASRPYPVYVSKTVPSKESTPGGGGESRREGRGGKGAAAGFNLQEALRQIDAHVNQLRNELKAAQAKLKNDERRPRRGAERNAPVVEGEPTLEEMVRLNHQLEARIAELQTRLDELTVDAEDRAASLGVATPEPVSNPEAALRSLLALKLQEDYEDFLALERESFDIVVQQHHRTLLRHIFEVLAQEGVPLKSPQ